MRDFDYQIPTRLIFGRDVVKKHLRKVMQGFGERVLLTYGGGSIKRSGLYDEVKSLLEGKQIFELGGIQPNPKYDPSVLDGVRICKQERIDVILAVGGGSVLDCTKAIAAGAKYDGETWDLITAKVPTRDALPIVDIITLAATGSEYDQFGVISRTETKDKIGYAARAVYPKVSLIDPQYTFTLPLKQTLAGVADCINHIMESYFVGEHIDMNDAFMEGAVRSLVKNTRKVMENPEDYDARAEIFYATTLGCNGIYCLGNSAGGWPMHSIEHALSGFHDITHGEGLAIVAPRWMRYILTHTTGALQLSVEERCRKFGEGVFGTTTAEQAIDALYAFFKGVGIPMSLEEVGVPESSLEAISQHIAQTEGLEEAWVPLRYDDILSILKDCMR